MFALFNPAREVHRADYSDGSAGSIDIGGSDGATKSLKEWYCIDRKPMMLLCKIWKAWSSETLVAVLSSGLVREKHLFKSKPWMPREMPPSALV